MTNFTPEMSPVPCHLTIPMLTASYTTVQFLQRQAASLLLYQSVLHNEVGRTFLNLLQTVRYTDADGRDCLQAYGSYFQALASSEQTWEEYLLKQILIADNPFSKLAQRQEYSKLPSSLVAAVEHDLQILQSLYECNSAILSEWVQMATHLPISPVVWYREPETARTQTGLMAIIPQLQNWSDAVEDLARYYREHGTGLFAQYQAFRWQNGALVGITYPDRVKLSTLVGYEWQKDALVKNTEFFIVRRNRTARITLW